jgi:hypothetical protein
MRAVSPAPPSGMQCLLHVRRRRRGRPQAGRHAIGAGQELAVGKLNGDAERNEPQADLGYLVENMPPGFRASLTPSRDALRIVYRRHGMGCMLFFLGFWLLFWTVGGFFAVYMVVTRHEMSLLIWLAFWLLGEALVACFLMWYLFGRTHVVLEPQLLRVQKVLFGWQRGWSVKRDEVELIRQVQDGGTGEDSFPSWGLEVVAGKTWNILGRQAPEKSEWLGRVLAAWSGVPFRPAPGREGS